MRKICIVITNRAPFGRLKSALRAIQEHPDLELQLVLAGSMLLEKYGGTEYIEKDFPVAEKIYTVVEGSTPGCMALTTGLFITQLTNTFERLKPDVVLVHADRYEQLAIATTAAYMNIKLAHTQGGEISGSIDDKVRNSISQLADIHFSATEQSKQRLINMGCENVYNVGCPSIDIIPKDLSVKEDFFDKYKGVGGRIDCSYPYIVVLQHPVTTEFGSGTEQIRETIKAIQALKMPTVWLWPNVDAGTDEISKELRKWRELEKPDYVHFLKNLEPEDYYRLIANCSCLIGNTSSGIREGSFLGTPYICIGSRQNQRERGRNVLFSEYDRNHIYSAYIEHSSKYGPDYRFGNSTAGKQIADILAVI